MVAIFVILTIVAFITVDSIVQWNEARKRAPAPQPAPGLIPAFAFEAASVPGGVFLDAGHTWVSVDTLGWAQVGMDDFAQRTMGRIDAVELPAGGQEVHRGDPLFTVRQGQRTATFTSPIDGVVHAVNQSLNQYPETMKENPYREGWVCHIKPSHLARNLKQLAIAEEARAWFDREVQRFQEFFAARPIATMAMGQVLQDGGQLSDGVLEFMDDETWDLFTSEFLHRPGSENGGQ
jgi:glycine cleavage system H protein